ncbi:MAG TPA: PHB depolymerase family esterase, partial [Methylomirabilota bacterium]|nr:PHB depolymerase family esterase [Methylomirabilota bacterium]
MQTVILGALGVPFRHLMTHRFETRDATPASLSLVNKGTSLKNRLTSPRIMGHLLPSWSVALACLAAATPASAQSNVRAHYAHGQVWVTWDVQDAVVTNCVPTLTPALSNGLPVVVSNCLPATYAIYWSENPVTNTTTATLVGRLFEQEWSAAILRDNVQASFGVRPTGFRIPDGAGGYRVLAANEGLFVHTVRSNFAGHYAVRPFGVTNVPPAWRAALSNAVFDLADPPTCHLQARGTNQGYPVEWWTMWADGDTHLGAARPDFPIMENDRRRGLPHNLAIIYPAGGSLPPTNIPACVALHSGDAQAKMWLPANTGFKSIGLAPVGQILVAVEDRFFNTRNGVVDPDSILSTGYVPSFDPFFDHQISPVLSSPPNHLPGSNEVIVPYPLYRLNWTLDWLYAHKSVDSNRVALVGHSGGAKGSLLWSHASPERFAYVGFYNPAFGQFPALDARFIGTREQDLPLLLTNRAGQLVRATDIHQFAASYSPRRDLPFSRVFHGKREENWVLDDDQDGLADLGETYRQADALGLGAAVFWDLRKHGLDTMTFATLSNDVAHPNNCGTNPTVNISGPWGIADLWVPTLATQFRRDDATNQIRHRADRSYPAFFNCALRGGHEDVGTVIYTNNSGPYLDNTPYDGLVTTTECLPPWTGDARGTWGGYFDWEPDIIDTETNWSAVLFLVGPLSAFSPVEICPDLLRVADVAIRRPQHFKPLAGTRLDWQLENAATGALITNGTVAVGADDLVAIPALPIPRDPLRARLTVSLAQGAPPACPAPALSIRQLTNGLLELSWPSCPSNSYQIEWTRTFRNWAWLTPPLAAPPTGGTMTWTTPVSPPYQFFRLVVWPLTNSPVPSTPGIHGGLKLTHNGIVRNYRLNIPAGYDPAQPAPLMLVLHGHNQSADEFAGNQPFLTQYANALGVILVFPDGTASERGTGWNTLDPTPEHPIDDVGFLLALIDELDTALNIDRKRVYAGGFSNGGKMCHFLGARTTNVFAAFAAVGSAIGGELIPR